MRNERIVAEIGAPKSAVNDLVDVDHANELAGCSQDDETSIVRGLLKTGRDTCDTPSACREAAPTAEGKPGCVEQRPGSSIHRARTASSGELASGHCRLTLYTRLRT